MSEAEISASRSESLARVHGSLVDCIRNGPPSRTAVLGSTIVEHRDKDRTLFFEFLDSKFEMAYWLASTDHYAEWKWTEELVTTLKERHFLDVGIRAAIEKARARLAKAVFYKKKSDPDAVAKIEAMWHCPGMPGFQETSAHFERMKEEQGEEDVSRKRRRV